MSSHPAEEVGHAPRRPMVPVRAWWPSIRRHAYWAVAAAGLAGLGYARFLRPVVVSTHTVAHGDLVVETFARGTLEARRTAQLGFDLPGRLAAVLVEEGDRILIGQEVARIEAAQYGAELRTAASSLEASRATLGRLQAEERSARESLDLAEREFRRVEALLASNAIAASEGDAAATRTRVARAGLDRVLAQRVEATRAIEVASRGVEQRRTNFVRATLLAPFDGVVTRRFHEPGDTVGIGSTVVQIADPSDLVVRAWVDETALPMIREGQSARVTLVSDSVERAGIVQLVGHEVDRQTHELVVEIRVDVPARVALGQRANVRIEVGRREGSLTLPLAFLRRDGNAAFVWVARGGRIRRSDVVTGASGRDAVEVTGGLAEGDVVLAPLRAGDLPTGRRWRAR